MVTKYIIHSYGELQSVLRGIEIDKDAKVFWEFQGNNCSIEGRSIKLVHDTTKKKETLTILIEEHYTGQR